MAGYLLTQSYYSKVHGFKGMLDNIVFVSDFDYTLNKDLLLNDSNMRSSSFGVVKSVKKCLPYLAGFLELNEKYGPIERGSYTLEKKIDAMIEWPKETGKLFVQAKLNKDDLIEAVYNDNFQLREGAEELMNYSKEENLPFFALSAGIGQIIEGFFERFKISAPHIIANYFLVNDNLIAGFDGEIIHPYNKSITINTHPLFSKIKTLPERRYILIGDMPDDTHMLNGIDIIDQHILKIAVLNQENAGMIEQYKASFDVIITDGTLSPVIKIISFFQ